MAVLVLAEKPSVASDIAKVLGAKTKKNGYIEGNDYYISWCFGHLVELTDASSYNEEYKKWRLSDLPIIPENFKLQIKDSAKEQFYNIKKLVNSSDVTEIICATDAGREGQLIFEWTYRMTGCKKPVKRLWISSLTEKSIKEGFENLKNNKEYQNLLFSAESRAKADWLFGINATRAISCINNNKLSVGRVQTPTLAIIVNRQKEINDFVSKPYFQVGGTFKSVNFLYKDKDNNSDFDKKEDAQKILDSVNGKKGTVKTVKKSKKTEDRPQLYDLTELQRDANNKYGFTAQETLDLAQSLYEKHKILTYPRTDSRYISDDVAAELKSVLGAVGLGWVETQPIIKSIVAKGLNLDKKIVDASKVSDHHAIIPTEKAKDYEKMSLSPSEDKIYKLVVTRLLATLSQKYEYLETSVTIDVNDHNFYATYKKPEFMGWKSVYQTLLKPEKKSDSESEVVSSVFTEGETITADKYEIIEKQTTPPKPFTEATLLSAMENISRKVDGEYKEFLTSGLGTPATRAGIIERLKTVGYITSKGKTLIATEKGVSLIDIVPVKFKQPELTAEWESRLENIKNGKDTQSGFISDLSEYMKSITKEIIENQKEYKTDNLSNNSSGKEVIGKCPKCGRDIYENDKSFYCSGYKSEEPCKFSIWKENKWFTFRGKKSITKAQAKMFLSKGECKITGLKTKEGKTYDAIVVMDLSDDRWVNFDFKKSSTTNTSSTTSEETTSETSSNNTKEVIGKCPKCGRDVYENDKSFYCSGYKDEPACKFSIWKENKWFIFRGKKSITKAQAKSFLSKGECKVTGFKTKDGKTYDAIVIMDTSNDKWVNFDLKPKN